METLTDILNELDLFSDDDDLLIYDSQIEKGVEND
jgi:hypothetical protein